MADEANIAEVANEIKNKSDEELKKTIKQWYEKTHTQGLKLGARMICAAGTDILTKHIRKKDKPSLRDYKRATEELIHLFSIPIKQAETEQNNLETMEKSNGEESNI